MDESVVTNPLQDFYVFCSKNILTKLIRYQQPTCLCVKFEFLVGTILLSCELFALSCSCFRSSGSDTIAYGKWCFELHVECCGSCVVSTISVAAGKFLGVRRILPEFSQTCPKSFGRPCLQFFSLKDHEDLFGMTCKKGFRVFFCKRWAPYYEIKQSRTPFIPDFQRFWADFQ